MKLKAHEAVFIAITVCAAAIAFLCAFVPRFHPQSEISVSLAETETESYDISVINSASVKDFMEIHGIGEVRATAIVEYRKAIGGFRRLSQLKDVSGISDAALELIIAHFYSETGSEVTTAAVPEEEPPLTSEEEKVTVTTVPENTTVTETVTESERVPETTAKPIEKVMHEVNINEASAEEISDALLIDIELAEEIVELRRQIHYFSTPQELYFCKGMNDAIYKKVKNYVKTGD